MGMTLAELCQRMTAAEFALHLQLEISRQPEEQPEVLEFLG